MHKMSLQFSGWAKTFACMLTHTSDMQLIDYTRKTTSLIPVASKSITAKFTSNAESIPVISEVVQRPFHRKC